MKIYEDLFDEISADDFREDVRDKIESGPEEKPDPDDPRFAFIIDVSAPKMKRMTSRKTLKNAIGKMSEMIEALLSTVDVTECSRVAVYSSVPHHKDIDFFENKKRIIYENGLSVHFVAGFNYSSTNPKSVFRFICAVSRLSDFYSQEYNSGQATIYKSGLDSSNINNRIFIHRGIDFSRFGLYKNGEFPFSPNQNVKYDMSELVSWNYFLTGVSMTDISLYKKIERTVTGGFIGKYTLYEAGCFRQGARGYVTPVTLSGKFFDGKIAKLSTFEDTGGVFCDYVISPASYSGNIFNIPFDKNRKSETLITPNSFTGIVMNKPIFGSDVPVNSSAVTVVTSNYNYNYINVCLHLGPFSVNKYYIEECVFVLAARFPEMNETFIRHASKTLTENLNMIFDEDFGDGFAETLSEKCILCAGIR